MSKRKAITLGVFTAWPFLYMILFMFMMVGMMMSAASGRDHSSGPPTIIFIIFPLHILTILEIFALLVIYIAHLFKTDRVPQDKKALWAVVLFVGNMIAMPIYWYLYIWSEPTKLTPEPTSAASPVMDR